MPSVTFDGRSFLLDGKRIWIVSGAIHMHRIPRAEWASRIHAAKTAGLNTIDLSVCWARHETRPGVFDFEADNDLRHFVELIGKAGMWCILRPGPYIGDNWDLGGIPPWVIEIPRVQIRSNNGPFLEACSRYLGAVIERVRSLQVTSPGAGGPILLVQNESGWNCSHSAIAHGYLGELNRYLREGGITVPIINANSLWQTVEGEIDCWLGTENMLPALRQLSIVRSDQPRIVIDFPMGEASMHGADEAGHDDVRVGLSRPLDPWAIQRRLAEIIAGGGQFNIQPFAGGSTPGFLTGRLPVGPAVFVGRDNTREGPILETGEHGASYQAVRKIATFASRFWRVLSSLDQSYQPVTLDVATSRPEPARGKKSAPVTAEEPRIAVVHTAGQQGGVVFVFGPDPSVTGRPPTPRAVNILLTDGVTLPVPMGRQAVVWCLIDAPLGGRASLDYCNLCALAVVGKVFVCYGPAGAKGVLSINGSVFEVAVPGGKAPLTEEHEGITVVVCNEDQADAVYPTDDAVFLGVSGISVEGRPLAPAGVRHVTRIASDGSVSQVAADHPRPLGTNAKVHCSPWTVAPLDEYVQGVSARFATIKGPGDLSSLGAPYGYGWYRVSFKPSAPRKVRVAFPHAADRVVAFTDGSRSGVIGVGSGAHRHLSIPLRKPATDVVFLAANLGRFSEGGMLADRKGLYGHGWEVDPIRVPRPKIVTADPVEILPFRAPLWEVREDDTTIPERITWSLGRRGKSSVIVWLRDKNGRGFMGRALLLLDGNPIEVIEYGCPDHVLLDAEQISRGSHTISAALLPQSLADDFDGDLAAAAKALESVVSFEAASEPFTARAEWSFAKWEHPPVSAYQALARSSPSQVPAWWRCSFDFDPSARGVAITVSGLSTGQVYVNNAHLGRYFLRKGQAERMIVHASRLNPGKGNDLVIFDERGASPVRGVQLSLVP
ncbi:MAG: beta-galactosidase [Phycisphaeraceae bacterium]|nr:beta-galactosidase [Phycisphaerae bacterium]MBX3391883.1 beta-galactosidase [Phycisphaeraceae bacterium]